MVDARRIWRVVTPSSLDFKLGYRMLIRYPNLTAIAVLAMAFGIAGGATGFEVVKDAVFPPLPYSDAARVVAIRNVNVETTRPDARATYDFAQWRAHLRTVEMLSALSLRDRNLTLPRGAVAPVAEAAVSANAFRLTNVAPLRGRGLISDDERGDAPAVVVIGYEIWQTRFGGASDVVGTVVRLGGDATTVIGVMPKGFTFLMPREGFTTPPSQDVWVPLRVHAGSVAPSEGRPLAVFGRLVPSATLEDARTELAAVAPRIAAESPVARDSMRPELLAFPLPFKNAAGVGPSAAISLTTVFIATLMIVVCGNVALLLFARAATREREIALRNALGASRGRIVAQLFVEALVLAAVAIVVGLIGATFGLRWVEGSMQSMMQSQGLSMPPWVNGALSPTTIGYAVALAMIGAVVAGVLPGIKVTSPRDRTTLQRLAGGTAVPLSGMWTGIIVTQVALTVILVPIAGVYGMQTWKLGDVDRNLPGAEYLAVRLETDADARSRRGDSLTRVDRSYRELARRLASEPGVTAVAVASHLPGSYHDTRRFEIDEPGDSAAKTWHGAQIASVDPGFFEVMRAPIRFGRGFQSTDVQETPHVVVVNESLVREYFQGRNAVGRRLRYRTRDNDGPWYTIIGVSSDLAMTIDPTIPSNAGIYHPLRPNEPYPIEMAVRVAGNAATFVPRLRDLAADVSPTLRVQRALPLQQAAQANLITYDATFRGIVLIGLLAILLTNAGVYAVVSFTVARRTREIGVRVALGADRRQVLEAILSRTTRHVAIGVVLGATFGSIIAFAFAEGSVRPSLLQIGVLLAVYVCGAMGACLLAAVLPARRALRIQPMQALAAEG